MWKRIASSLLVFIVIFSLSTVGYAASSTNAKRKTTKVDPSKYQVNTPEEDSSSNKKTVLISGKAPEGTNIIIEVYGAVDLTGKNYTLAKLPKNEDYILISTQNIKSGRAGFGEEIELIMGINKVIVTFNVKGVPSQERIIYYYEMERVEESANNPMKLPLAK